MYHRLTKTGRELLMHIDTQVKKIDVNVRKGSLNRNDALLLSLMVENLKNEIKELPTEEEVRAFEESEGYFYKSM